MALGLLFSSACGQTGLVEPETPVASLRAPLEADRPGGLPPEVLEAKVEIYGLPIATLESAIRRTVESAEFQKGSENLGVRPAFLPAAQFSDLISKEDASLSRLMQLIGLKKPR